MTKQALLREWGIICAYSVHPGRIQARDKPFCAPYFKSSHKGHTSFAFTGRPLHILGIKFHADLEIRRDYVSPIVASFAQHGFLFGVLSNGKWSWVLLLHHHPLLLATEAAFYPLDILSFYASCVAGKESERSMLERTQLFFWHRLTWGPWTSGPGDVEHIQSYVANYIHFIGWLDLAVGVLVFKKARRGSSSFGMHPSGRIQDFCCSVLNLEIAEGGIWGPNNSFLPTPENLEAWTVRSSSAYPVASVALNRKRSLWSRGVQKCMNRTRAVGVMTKLADQSPVRTRGWFK